MTSYKINTEKNGLEITFPEMPNKTTRETLKANGWRWSRFGGFWYNRNTPENEQMARDLSDGKAPIMPSAPATRKSPFTSDKVIDRYIKDVIGYVKLSSGQYVPFEKSKILTHLCFGYDELIPETVDQAGRNRSAAVNKYDYFEKCQTAEIDRDIAQIERALAAQNEMAKGGINCFSMSDFIWTAPNDWRGDKIAIWRRWNPNDETIDQALKADDLRAILDGLKAQKEYKQKQARIYWKRFGGSKLHAWTYSVND